MNPRNIASSVRQRLKNLSQQQGEEFQSLLTRYALERFLYRLSQSNYRDTFILKGALLFSIWSEQPHRATRDLDLLGCGDNTLSHLKEIFSEICQVQVQSDGLEFNPDTVNSQRIKEDQEYEGVRINLQANLAGSNTRILIQIDIGFGDVVTPVPIKILFPTLLNFPAPEVQTYPRETVVSEKFQALVMLGMTNSRLKDFYDLWFLARNFEFDGEVLQRAIKATFNRRRTPLEKVTPLALTSEFSSSPAKQTQWNAFLRKGKLETDGKTFTDVISFLQNFLMPPLTAASEGETFSKIWLTVGTWRSK